MSCHPPRSTTAPTAVSLDPHAAEQFVRDQTAWLCRGLGQAGDAITVRRVVAAHDASHERWVALLAATREHADAADEALAALYTEHGRARGALERPRDTLLSPSIIGRVHALMADRLVELTDAAVAALAAAAPASTAPAASRH